MQKIKQKKLKPTLRTILFFFYRFRFLTTRHIQVFLNNKHPRYAQTVLKQLRETGYLYSFYDRTTVTSVATPAIYCLTTKARYILRENENCNAKFLENLYREKIKSVKFQNHCLFLVDIYFLIKKHVLEHDGNFHFSTKTALLGYSDFPTPLPDALIALFQKGKIQELYLVILIDPQTPWFVILSYVRKYLTYFEENTWEENMGSKKPTLLFICFEQRSIRYLKKAIKTVREEYYITDLHIVYTTKDALLKNGFQKNTFVEIPLVEIY